MPALIVPGQLMGYELPMATRRRNQIANFHNTEAITHLYMCVDADLRKNHPRALFRTGPAATYNCHGLTFGSRRTTIDESEEVRKILKEDDYERVDPKNVSPGDVVLYINSKTGDVEHSATVVSMEALGVPKVLSKWGHFSEAVHLLPDCDYDAERVEYYRVTK